MRQQVSKVSAHVETLLDLMLDAWGKWALLEPILKDRTTIAAWGGGKRGRALDGIRRSLMHVCILDIAHVAFEPDDRSPSVEKVLHDIANPSTLKLIKADFMAAWVGPKSASPDYDERLMEAESRFEADLALIKEEWAKLERSAQLRSFKKFRDKNLAHVELMYEDGKYRQLKVSTLGIKWRDIGLILAELQTVVLGLNRLCRCAHLDMDDARQQFQQSAELFWHARSVA